MAKIGEVHEISGQLEIEWRIKNFFSLYQNGRVRHSIYETSAFYFAGETWKITLSPEEIDWEEKTVAAVKLGLMRLSFGPPVTIEYSIGVKNVEGRKMILDTHLPGYPFPGYPFEHTVPKFILRGMLEEKKTDLLPNDVLTLICSLKSMESKEITKSCLTKVFDVVDNFKEIVKSGKVPDVTFRVDNRKVHVHRIILDNRSPVFAKMFSHDLPEKQPLEFDVKDIDFSSLDAVLFFMYTGDIMELSRENVLSVYVAADKFEVEELKQICSDYIRRNLTDGWVCEVIKFAEIQKAEEMRQIAREYFCERAARIIKTNSWKTFLKDNLNICTDFLSSAVEKLSLNYP